MARSETFFIVCPNNAVHLYFPSQAVCMSVSKWQMIRIKNVGLWQWVLTSSKAFILDKLWSTHLGEKTFYVEEWKESMMALTSSHYLSDSCTFATSADCKILVGAMDLHIQLWTIS